MSEHGAIEPTWKSKCGRVKLWLGDCREVKLPKCDALVVDPPYGINADKAQSNRANSRYGKAMAASKDYGKTNWDNPLSCEDVSIMRDLGKYQIIFGGNYFELPPSRCWLVWDKWNGKNDYADCELAWTNLNKPVRRLIFQWHGMLRDEEVERVHPTQKPVGVMMWAISHLPEGCETIIDPYMGSASTGIACIRRQAHRKRTFPRRPVRRAKIIPDFPCTS